MVVFLKAPSLYVNALRRLQSENSSINLADLHRALCDQCEVSKSKAPPKRTFTPKNRHFSGDNMEITDLGKAVSPASLSEGR